jgi:environmental stress-induced protein Ves
LESDVHISRCLSKTPSVAWKNGGGLTQELLVWPTPNNWVVRLSVATIESDGAFSRFDHVWRWFVPIEGHGVSLTVSGHASAIDSRSDPIGFKGEAPCSVQLLQGPVKAFNVMLQGRWRADVCRIAQGQLRTLPGTGYLALFCVQSGACQIGEQVLHCDSGQLLWQSLNAPLKVLAASGHWLVTHAWA